MNNEKRWWPERFDSYFKPRSPRDTPNQTTANQTAPNQTTANQTATKAGESWSLTTGIAPLADPLTVQDANHFLRRALYGGSAATAAAMAGQSIDNIVDDLVDHAINAPLPDPPHWHNAFLPAQGEPEEVFEAYFQNNIRWGNEYARDWFKSIFYEGLRERLAVFWHDHFVTERETYFFAPMAYQYVTMLRSHALGNFKGFVRSVTLNPAMLVYLNGSENIQQEPNENYARELLELFTMGQYDVDGNPNYTQDDIVELSRALTGWFVDYQNFSAAWAQHRYDAGPKDIFGVTGFYNYRRVIDHIFEMRGPQIAQFICRKLYVAFIYNTPDEAFISELAQVFLDHDFEIAPVIRTLFKSERFFDHALRGARLKSPLALFMNLLHQIDFTLIRPEPYEVMYRKTAELGQQLLQPPNVAGWEGYRNWITTATLPSRWELIEQLLRGDLTGRVTSLVPAAENLVDAQDPHYVFKLPVALAELFMPIPVENLSYETPTTTLSGDLINHPIPEEVLNAPPHVLDLTTIFLAGRPWYEWSLQSPGIVFQLLDYVQFLVELPEYQLT